MAAELSVHLDPLVSTITNYRLVTCRFFCPLLWQDKENGSGKIGADPLTARRDGPIRFGMAEAWMSAPSPETRELTTKERGDVLIDLLLLTDALPPRRHEPLLAPPFRELCARA